MMMTRVKRTVIAAMLVVSPVAAQARSLTYTAALSGNSASASTGSTATATAEIIVDTKAMTVAVRMQVIGMPLAALWDTLVAAPIGPVHLHQYAGTDLSDPNASMLAFPLPFGPSYHATEDGFAVDTGPQSYAKGMATLGSKASFEQFVAALDRGAIVLNIHSDSFNAGEISGPVVKARS